MNFVSIKSYRFYKPSQVRYTKQRSVLEEAMANTEDTTFEVLKSNYMRIFLDLENIPLDITDKDNNLFDMNDDSIMHSIIDEFIKFAELRSDIGYVVTKNFGSHHPGLSYHVIFSAVSLRDNIKNLVCKFKEAHPEFNSYVDSSIYTRNRLFRLPEQYGISDTDNRRHDDKEPDDVVLDKRIKKANCCEDVHHILMVCGKALTEDPYEIDYIIQNTIGCECYSKIWMPVDRDVEAAMNTFDFSNNTNHDITSLGTLSRLFNYVKKYFKL